MSVPITAFHRVKSGGGGGATDGTAPQMKIGLKGKSPEKQDNDVLSFENR